MRFAIVTLWLVFAGVAASQEKKLEEFDIRYFKPGSDAAKAAPDLLWKHFKAERDDVNRQSLAWPYSSKAEWEKLRDVKIALLKQSLGTFPEPPARIEVHRTKTLQGDGFVIENLLYQSRPGLWVSANLYRPEPMPNSLPGLVIVHSHHNPKTEGELQDMGVLWARAGCMVLIPDLLGHGERRQHPFHSAKDYPKAFKVGRQDYYFRYNLDLQLGLVGESLAGWMAWDLSRGFDLLLQKPGVDEKRLAILGSVAGGGDIAAITAALDPRIQVVALFNFGGPQPETVFPLPADADASFDYVGGASWESTRNLRRSAADGFLPWIIVASVAPRKIIHAHEFAWDQSRDPAWRRYKKILAFYDANDSLHAVFGRGSVRGKPPESTHCNNIGSEHRAMIHPALNRWFGIEAKESSQRFTASELQCWTPESKERLKPKMVHELVQAKIDQTDRKAMMVHALNYWKRRLDQPTAPQALPQDKEVTSFELKTRIGLPIVATLLHPSVEQQKPDAPQRFVIAFCQQGRTAFLKERADVVRSLLQKQTTVLLLDLPGTGETRTGDGRGRTSSATSISAMAQMFGISLYEIRLAALLEALQQVRHHAKGRTLKIAVMGDSLAPTNPSDENLDIPYDVDPFPRIGEPQAGLLALLAPSLSSIPIDAVIACGTVSDLRTLAEHPLSFLPHDAFEPGLALKIDLTQLIRPKHLLNHGRINSRNQGIEPRLQNAQIIEWLDSWISN